MVSEVSKDTVSASSEAVERLEAYALGQSRYKAWRGEAPAGEPTLRRDLMLAVSTIRSQAEALEKARQDTVNEMADGLDAVRLTPVKKELVKAAFRAAIAHMNVRAALTPEVKS